MYTGVKQTNFLAEHGIRAQGFFTRDSSAKLNRSYKRKILFLELGVGSNTPVLTASFAKHRKSTKNDTVRPSYGYFMKEIGGGENTMKVRAA